MRAFARGLLTTTGFLVLLGGTLLGEGIVWISMSFGSSSGSFDERGVLMALVLAAGIPLGAGLLMVEAALKPSATVRAAVGILLLVIVAPVGLLMDFSMVGPQMDGTPYTQADAWYSAPAVGGLPAVIGLCFLLSAFRAARRTRHFLPAAPRP